MNVKACIYTDAGKRKRVNQDSSLIKVANSGKLGRISFVVVCDGMGGLKKGEIASCKAVRAMEYWFHEEFIMLQDMGEDDIIEAVERSWNGVISRVNSDIKKYGRHRGISLGTTMAALLQVGHRFILLNVGDSRIYMLGRKNIKQLSDDQSIGSVLLQCIGASNAPAAQIVKGKLSGDTTVVACTDGLWRTIGQKEIFNALCPQMCVTQKDMLEQCMELVDTALNRNEQDNITVAALCMEF